MEKSNYKVELRIVTPVVINTGKQYQFCEVYPRCVDKKYQIYQISVDRAVSFVDSEVLEAAIKKASDAFRQSDSPSRKSQLKSAREMLCVGMKEKESLKQIVVRPLKVKANEGNSIRTENVAEKIWDNPMLVINKIADNPQNGLPYIPGSSIKGSLRTGCLESIRNGNGLIPEEREKAKTFEARIYGQSKFSVQEDPFKYLKISDFHFEDYRTPTYIVSAPNNAYTAATASEFYLNRSVIASGEITLDDRFHLAGDLDRILQTASEFFVANYNYGINKEFTKTEAARKVTQIIQDGLDNDYYLLRLGHYSGIQNCTFNVTNPFPPRRNNNSKINIEGGKLMLLDNEAPAGICLIKIIS